VTRGHQAAACGTASGRSKHQRAGEPVCDACKAAYAAAERGRAARRQMGSSKPNLTHGLAASYRYGGCRCNLCTQAMRQLSQRTSAQYRARNAERLRPCGTLAGVNRHREAGEPLCLACQMAAIEAEGRHYAATRGEGGRFEPSSMSDEQRFLAAVEHSEGHWLWRLGLDDDGYANFKVRGQSQRAHRWSYGHFIGPIPDGLQIDHLCHGREPACPGGATCIHRRCVNPAHLEAVTGAENSARGRSVNRDKTHCPADHEYTPENTYVQPSRPKSRRCRACAAARRKS